MLCIDGLCSTSSAPNGLNEWLWPNGCVSYDELLRIRFSIIYFYVTPCPMVMCIVSTTFIIFESWYIYLALLNLYLRDPSLERKASFFLKVVFVVTLGFTSYNLGTFWVLTNWRRFQGTKVHIFPGRMTVFKEDLCGQTWFFNSKKVVYLSWRLHCKTSSELKKSF